MREILFRGKRKDNGEWVYGYYVAADNKSYIFTGKTGLSQVTPAHRLMYKDFARYEVIPETVGQFTGFTDSKGVKVFEGDIVHYDLRDSNLEIAFYNGYWGLLNDGGAAVELFIAVEIGDVKVVGNIHDIPKFLAQDKE
jgi:uncharacterized phage protein (TIGR01671 family)